MITVQYCIFTLANQTFYPQKCSPFQCDDFVLILERAELETSLNTSVNVLPSLFLCIECHIVLPLFLLY